MTVNRMRKVEIQIINQAKTTTRITTHRMFEGKRISFQAVTCAKLLTHTKYKDEANLEMPIFFFLGRSIGGLCFWRVIESKEYVTYYSLHLIKI